MIIYAFDLLQKRATRFHVSDLWPVAGIPIPVCLTGGGGPALCHFVAISYGRHSLLRRQLRYSFKTGSAFVMATSEGLHGTILHERAVTQRYPKLAKSEDTAFLKSFSKHVTIDNDPVLYVRFHHGFNTWDEPHIMRHLAGELDSWELNGRQQSMLAGEVLPDYTGWVKEASCAEVRQKP